MQVMSEMGQPRSVVSYEELREFIKKFVGLPLEDKEIDRMLQQPVPNTPQGTPQQPMQSADAPLSAGGSPMQSNLPPQPVMMGGAR
jgi:hypothetical protein